MAFLYLRQRQKSDGKAVAKYKIDALEETIKKGGMLPFPKGLEKRVSARSKCLACGIALGDRYLKIDHRVSFDAQADAADRRP